jgi:hypothetical protein
MAASQMNHSAAVLLVVVLLPVVVMEARGMYAYTYAYIHELQFGLMFC